LEVGTTIDEYSYDHRPVYGRNVYEKNACIWEFASRRVAGFYNTRNTLTQNTLRKDNVIPIFWGAFRVDKMYSSSGTKKAQVL
jgi:hypothetical protein